jgi:uncharacterized membrane protein YhaH (DUF805 family)
MEKQYYFFNGTEQIGPLSYSDLQSKNPTPEMLFWYEGLPTWKKGAELPELAGLFNRMPPPLSTPTNPVYNQPPFTGQQSQPYNPQQVPPYNNPNPQYQNPNPQYQQSNPNYQNPNPQYQQPNQNYQNPNPQYQQYGHTQLRPTPPVYEWYIMAWQKYAQFTGRARRSEYWYFFLFHLIISFVLIYIGGSRGNYYNGEYYGTRSYGMLYNVYQLAVLLPALAVGVRRMHDVGKSGWFLLIPIYNLILACTEGDRGPNQYGADPKYM